MKTIKYLLISLLLFGFAIPDFKSNQLKNNRVKTAYKEKETVVKTSLNNLKLNITELEIYIRVFKKDELLELWGKNKSDNKFKLIKSYSICSLSGYLGPKRKQGDYQIPEGFYHIDRFNPWSNFYLSLGINYPNKSDRILGVKTNLGGDIFIHGNCVTIGCVPITDDKIKELYIYCIEAKNNGQTKIPVSIFPMKLIDKNYNELKEKYSNDKDKLNLWADLKKEFDLFERNRILPKIYFLSNGRHKIE